MRPKIKTWANFTAKSIAPGPRWFWSMPADLKSLWEKNKIDFIVLIIKSNSLFKTVLKQSVKEWPEGLDPLCIYRNCRCEPFGRSCHVSPPACASECPPQDLLIFLRKKYNFLTHFHRGKNIEFSHPPEIWTAPSAVQLSLTRRIHFLWTVIEHSLHL